MLTETLLAFGTIFPIVNPFSTSLIFNQLSHRFTTEQRRRVALKASVTSAAAMLLFLALGKPMLTFFGVTIYAFRVAGGIYLAKIGFEMLSPQPRRSVDNYRKANEARIAIIPLAIPLLSGPGALTSVLVLAAEFRWLPVAIAILIVALLSWIILRHSHLMERVLGSVGSDVLERILGLLVLVVAVQFVFNGVTGYLGTIGWLG